MVKRLALISILLFLLIGFVSFDALSQSGSKITELTEDTAPTGDDLIITVDDPSGTPVNKKAKRQNFLGTKTLSIILTSSLTATDDFLVWRSPANITISNIHGVLQSGTSVTGGFDECDSNGANCVAVDADIAFDGLLDSDDGSLSNPTIDAGDWLKWHTTAVSNPGYLTITVYFKYD